MADDKDTKPADKPKDDEPVIAEGQDAKLAEMGIYQPYNEVPVNPEPPPTDEQKAYNEARAKFPALPSEKSGTASSAR